MAGSLLGGPRPALRLNYLSKWAWGAEPRRLVRVFVHADVYGALTATVYGAKGREVELLQTEAVAEVQRGRIPSITLADGTTWTMQPGGCGCSSPLKHYRPPT